MKASAVADFFAVVELRTKIVSVSTLSLATAYACRRTGFPAPIPFLLMWAAVLAVDMGTTAFNNYFDYWRGTDHYLSVDEADKVLVRKGVPPGFAFWSAFWCFASAVVLGLALAAAGDWWVLPVGALGMAVGFLYTGGPFPISRGPLGELFAGGFLGFTLFVVACGVWSTPVDPRTAAAALPSFFWIASILTVNNTCDIEGDRAVGRKTLSVLLGSSGGRFAVVGFGLLGQLAAIALALEGVLPRAAAFSLAVALVPIAALWRAMVRDGFSHATKGRNMKRILACVILFTAASLAGYLPGLFGLRP